VHGGPAILVRFVEGAAGLDQRPRRTRTFLNRDVQGRPAILLLAMAVLMADFRGITARVLQPDEIGVSEDGGDDATAIADQVVADDSGAAPQQDGDGQQPQVADQTQSGSTEGDDQIVQQALNGEDNSDSSEEGPSAPAEQAAAQPAAQAPPAKPVAKAPAKPVSAATKPAAAATKPPVVSLSAVGKAAKQSPEKQVKIDAENAHTAAETAKQAAKVATKVAKHSVHVTNFAKSALKDAHDALHRARVDTQGLSSDQKESLKVAEAKLKEATKDAEYGQVKNAKYVKSEHNKDLAKMEAKMDKTKKTGSELEVMRKEVQELRKLLKKKQAGCEDKGETPEEEALKDLEQALEEMEKQEKKDGKPNTKSHDEIKAEIERLREQIMDMEECTPPPKEVKKPAPMDEEEEVEVTPVQEKGIDIDTAMPYGDLEPFGREDTAQELTEDSIGESDQMVDQIERAEVAEEKRAVFRALTRLRGAAITSFDGIARSQTGNIDEYNKLHKWRRTHPLHHLADEESDISKWAFPDNADF